LKDHKNGITLCWYDLVEGERLALRRADLRRANLQGADLQGADLQGADLQGADLLEADLREAGVIRIDCGSHQINAIGDMVQIGCKRMTVTEWGKFFEQDNWEGEAGEEGAMVSEVPQLRYWLKHIKGWLEGEE